MNATTATSASKTLEDIYEVRARALAGELSLRERHKLNKLERISSAAEKRFGQSGYEGTTLREIAKEADVALGTLSLYARDKRDLIVMLFNKLIPPLMTEGRSQCFSSAPLVDNLVAYFSPFYRAYARNCQLYRVVLGSIYNSPMSRHARELARIRAELINTLSDLILRARAAGEIADDGDVAVQARSFFYLYYAGVREWLAGETPSLQTGLRELRQMFSLHVHGLKAPAEAPPSRRKAK